MQKRLQFKVVDAQDDDAPGTANISYRYDPHEYYRYRGYYEYYDDDVSKKIEQWDWKEDDIMELIPARNVDEPKQPSTNTKNHDINKTGTRLKYSQDVKKDEVGLDMATKINLGVNTNDLVFLKRIQKIKAKQIDISPTSKINLKHLQNYMNENCLERVFTANDTFPIMTWPDGKSWVVVSNTVPSGPVYHTESTKIITGPKIKSSAVVESVIKTEYDGVGGLDNQIQQIREMIELPMWHPEIFKELGLNTPRGILLYGPPGTGKTLFAHTIAKASNVSFKAINGPEVLSKWVGESEERLRDLFADAKRKEPCIIFIDEIDSITPKREDTSANYQKQLVAQLLTLMDEIKKSERVMVIAATNMPSSIDPALRRPGRFDREIEIRVPDSIGRLDILKIHTKRIPLDPRVSLKLISKIAHGYTGADLYQLCQKATMKAIGRISPVIKTSQDNPPMKEYLSQISVTWDDFKQSLKEITPSALREVMVHVPNVKWEDIGGLEQKITILCESIEWPLRHAHDVNRYGIRVPHGILLHGPPGTGKTTIAKAIANTSGYNFISIKGPELLSKWVGESEKSVRTIFDKARQSAPCVIFFDEIDALLPSRGNDSRTHVTDGVVSQILTEIDGVEELQNVVVIGATNRIDIIDQAMLRPGRFDRIIEIPTPDENGREQILKIHTKEKPMDKSVKLNAIANITDKFSGADLRSVVELAAMAALRRRIESKNKNSNQQAKEINLCITQKDMQDAVKQIKQERMNKLGAS